jgi:hypothetical protein
MTSYPSKKRQDLASAMATRENPMGDGFPHDDVAKEKHPEAKDTTELSHTNPRKSVFSAITELYQRILRVGSEPEHPEVRRSKMKRC